MDKTKISEFIDNEGINVYLISLKGISHDLAQFSLQEYSFCFEKIGPKMVVTSTDDFLEEWVVNINHRIQRDTDIKEILEICTKEFGVLIGDDDEEELVFYSNVENDNYDMKFLDRVRFGEDDFNPDLFVNIFEFLPGNHLLKIRRVSKLFQTLIEKDSLWERLIMLEDITNIDKSIPLFKNYMTFSVPFTWQNIIKVNEYQYYYSNPITKGIQKMKIRMTYIESTGHMLLGVCNDNTVQSGYIGDNSQGTNKTGYGYHPPGQSYHNAVISSYGEPFNTGDIITIIMDCKEMKVSFEKNGKNQGVAFNVTDKLPLYFFVCTAKGKDIYDIVK